MFNCLGYFGKHMLPLANIIATARNSTLIGPKRKDGGILTLCVGETHGEYNLFDSDCHCDQGGLGGMQLCEFRRGSSTYLIFQQGANADDQKKDNPPEKYMNLHNADEMPDRQTKNPCRNGSTEGAPDVPVVCRSLSHCQAGI